MNSNVIEIINKTQELIKKNNELIKNLEISNIQGIINKRKISINHELSLDLSLKLYEKNVSVKDLEKGKYDKLIKNFSKNNGIKEIDLKRDNEEFINPITKEYVTEQEYSDMLKRAYMSDVNKIKEEKKLEEIKELMKTKTKDELIKDAFTDSVNNIEKRKNEEIEAKIKKEKMRKDALETLFSNYSMNGSALDQLEQTGVYYHNKLKNNREIKEKSKIENLVIFINNKTNLMLEKIEKNKIKTINNKTYNVANSLSR